MSERLQVYETPGITVTFDPDRCLNSGACQRGLPKVFDEGRLHWIHPERAPAADVAEQAALCPSGALQVRLQEAVPRER